MRLSETKVGHSVRILQVDCERALRRRLLDMGLTPNTVVTVRKMAPLGDPMELTVRGYQLTLRKDDAKEILVEPAERPRHGHHMHRRGQGHPSHPHGPGRRPGKKDGAPFPHVSEEGNPPTEERDG